MKYDVMTVLGDEKLIMIITAEGNCVKLFAYNENLFNILHEIHLSIRHGDRIRIEYEVNKNLIYPFWGTSYSTKRQRREFVNKIISELCTTMWKDLKIVHGKALSKPRFS